jgi:hypothetical protein
MQSVCSALRYAMSVRPPCRDLSDTPIPPTDQEGEPVGELICRIMEGRNGNFMGVDARGRVLQVRRAKHGALELRQIGEPASDEAAPDIVGEYHGAIGDPARTAGRTGDALSQFQASGIRGSTCAPSRRCHSSPTG